MKKRLPVTMLTMSVAGFAVWCASESFSPTPYIPTKNDVPTIGYGSTRYEDGTQVKLTDKPITRQSAEKLARNLNDKEEIRFRASIQDVELTQEEFDLYMDFVGQYGIGNWRKSSMRRNLINGNYSDACKSLLKYKYQDGYDCSIPGNKRCYGVWTRQQARYKKCMEAQ